MKKNLLTAAFLLVSVPFFAQNVLCHVGDGGIFHIGENALVYSGGGIQTRGTGKYDISGNMMVVGGASDAIRTLAATGNTPKEDGGNIILRMNEPATYQTSKYGQLYIQGLSQLNLTGIVDKEYRNSKHGSYQQIALPFFEKQMSALSTEFGKVFRNARYSEDEILVWNDTKVRSDNFDVNGVTANSTAYYMLGNRGLDTSSRVFTIKGRPIANGVSKFLSNAGNGINFGPEGNNVNYYREKYNTYLQDMWVYPDFPLDPWAAPNFGKNIYQFGNPYLTNLDLKFIAQDETGLLSDGNALKRLQGIRYDPGVVETSGGTYSIGAQAITFTNETGVPTGDIGLIIKPMQTFVLKFRDNVGTGIDRTLSFDGLRRFSGSPRAAGTNNGVTAARGGTAVQNTVKQLGVIGLDENGVELGRTYYVVYANGVSGQTVQPTVQVANAYDNIIGTYEEDIVNGGADSNYTNLYWLYINEANEEDYKGKPILMELYENRIKQLKFELRENAELVADGTHALSSGTGFYYQAANGTVSEIKHNDIIPATVESYHLFYGGQNILDTDNVVKQSRTKVAFDRFQDSFLVVFDPSWSRADVQVYDMSGKLIISEKNVNAKSNFVLPIQKSNSTYIVTAVSENGEKISAKIIR